MDLQVMKANHHVVFNQHNKPKVTHTINFLEYLKYAGVSSGVPFIRLSA